MYSQLCHSSPMLSSVCTGLKKCLSISQVVSQKFKIKPSLCVGGLLVQVFVRTIRSISMAEGSQKDGDCMKYQHSVKVGSVFQNPWGDGKFPSLLDVRHFLWEKNQSNVPRNEKELSRTLPVQRLSPEVQTPPEKGIRVTWIGHATVLTQFDNISILADPIFSNRCSALSMIGPKRYRPPPCKISELPNIDAVCISHNHYDHLDTQSVKDLNACFGENLRWYVPLGLRGWMNDTGCTNVIELDWWDENILEKKLPNGDDVKITFAFTPTKHWCNRQLFDWNRVLWGSWTVLGPRYRYYFAGDTGYCDGFKQIGHRYGPIDVAAIPIGAYEPRKMMRKQHVNPEESVKIHQDVRANKSLGIHWGTFVLTYEHYLEPPKRLIEALDAQGIPREDFFTLDHGASTLIIPEGDH